MEIYASLVRICVFHSPFVCICRLAIKNKILFDELIFDKYEKLLKITTKIEFLSEMFQTSGCPNCNRPFYNENVRGPIYNYPDKINDDDLKEIKNQLEKYKVI